MFELIIRVVLASGTMALAGAMGKPNFDLAWRVSLFFAAYSYLLYVMEQRKARNAGVSGLAAVADSGILALVLADLGLIQQFGFLSALPLVIAFFVHRANAAMMAPLGASWLMVGTNMMTKTNAFTTEIMVQALGILLCGLVLQQSRTMLEERKTRRALEEILRPLEPEPEPTIAPTAIQIEATPTTHDEAEEIKESFRALTDSARELEKRTKRDKACVLMIERTMRDKAKPYHAVAGTLLDQTGAEGLVLYAVSQYGDALVARATSGAVEHETEEAALELTGGQTDAALLERASSLVHVLREPEGKRKFANVIMKAKGRIVGLVTLFHHSAIELEASVRKCRETLDFVSEHISELVHYEQTTRRLNEAELLYSIATMTVGAKTPEEIVGRVVRELWDTVSLDHLSAYFIEDGRSVLVAREGSDIEIMEEISFARGYGVSGWIESGAPFTSMPDARSDGRIATHAATKKRVGSLLIVPLEFGTTPIGYVVAATSRTAGTDLATTETIRVVCAEASHALAREALSGKGASGLTTPTNFYDAVRAAGRGHFVYLEVIKKDSLSEVYGKPAIEHAVRRFAVRMAAELPSGAVACRRSEGDYVAFIPGAEEEFVRNWSNDVIALASMIGVHTPDGRTRIPLALRSKLAPVNQQLSGISERTGA